jgi:phospholipid/cholesterol/gamma-HCH transport system substrate-binding protein
MATRAQTIKVGIFCIAGLALIVALVAIITIRKREPTETFFIKFTESVSGLGKDCTVLYQGVPVGKVEDIRVTENNEVLVSVGIATQRVTLHGGTTAVLAMGNLMGYMQIELAGGDPNAPELKAGSYIPSKQSVMENVAKNLPEILENIAGILAKIDRSIGDVKGDRLGSLVRNADETIQTANTTFAEMTAFLTTSRNTMLNMEYEVIQTMRDLREAIVQADRILARLNENPSSIIWGLPKPRRAYAR